MYKVVYHPVVISFDIPKLDSKVQQRIKKAIEQKLETSPQTFGLYLRNNLKGYMKLRVGDYRIIFRIEDKTKRVLVFIISHRSNAYKIILKRI
jgi:mRNA interferase RelE/StbE